MMLPTFNKRIFDRRANPRSPFGDIHPAVLKWRKNAMNAGSGAISGNTMRAMDWFYKEIKKYGIAQKIISMNCYAPDNLIAAITPLIHINETTWTNTAFIASDLTRHGLTGNGSTKYLNTGINPTIHLPSEASGGHTIYSNHIIAENAYGMGCQDNTGATTMMLYYLFSGTTYWDCWNGVGARISAVNTSFQGYISANRFSPTKNDIFTAAPNKIHSAIASSTGTGGTRPNFNIFVHAGSVNGTAATFSSRRYSFAATHYGLSSEESERFYYCITNLRIKLGGGFV